MIEVKLADTNRAMVEALRLIEDTPGSWALIGGFAVWCHLGRTHRPTLDIDVAAGPVAHETLVAAGSESDDGHRTLAGVKLDVIEVLDPTAALADLSEKERLFLVAHWHASTLTTPLRIVAGDNAAVVPVANTAPLLGCKLHAWLDRRDERANKRGSDGLDLVRLLEGTDWDKLDGELAANPLLTQVVGWAAEQVLTEQAARVARFIRVHVDVEPPPVDHIAALGHELISRCRL